MNDAEAAILASTQLRHQQLDGTGAALEIRHCVGLIDRYLMAPEVDSEALVGDRADVAGVGHSHRLALRRPGERGGW